MFDPPAEPVPKETLGKFMVNLQYIENGQEKIITDTVSCQYRGRACDGRGLHNDWSYTLASGKEKVVLNQIDKDKWLYKPTGGCKQLMEGEYSTEKSVALHFREGTWNVSKVVDPETLYNEYGIEVVSFSVTKKP